MHDQEHLARASTRPGGNVYPGRVRALLRRERQIGRNGLSVVGLDPEEVLLVVTSGAWDESWYLQEYPDVASHLVDPLLHYLVQGWRELRSPGPRFDARRYAESAGLHDIHPLLHYLGTITGWGEPRDVANRGPGPPFFESLRNASSRSDQPYYAGAQRESMNGVPHPRSTQINRLYDRLFSTSSTVNQLNLVHIELENFMTPSEAYALVDHIFHAPTRTSAASDRPDLWSHAGGWALALQDKLEAGPRNADRAMARYWRRRGALLFQRSASPARRLIVCFAGGARRLMMPVPVFLQHVCALDADVLILRGQRGSPTYSNGIPGVSAGFPGVVRWLRDFALRRPVAEIACVGTSHGALPSIVAGMQLGATSVLAAGTFSTDAAHLFEGTSACDLSDVVAVFRNYRLALPNVHLVFGDASDRDAATATVIAGLIPGGSVTTVPGAQHGCLWPLVQRGEFTDLLDRTIGAHWA